MKFFLVFKEKISQLIVLVLLPLQIGQLLLQCLQLLLDLVHDGSERAAIPDLKFVLLEPPRSGRLGLSVRYYLLKSFNQLGVFGADPEPGNKEDLAGAVLEGDSCDSRGF